jgi:hypothetical protein
LLNASAGITRGVAPVLYTYGNNDIPNVPVVNYPYSGHRVILELNFCTFYARCIQNIV